MTSVCGGERDAYGDYSHLQIGAMLPGIAGDGKRAHCTICDWAEREGEHEDRP